MKFEDTLKNIKQDITRKLTTGIPTWSINYDTADGTIDKTPSGILSAIIYINHQAVSNMKNTPSPSGVDDIYNRVITLVAYYHMAITNQVDKLDDEKSLLSFCYDLTDRIVQLLIEKNHDYGSSYLKVAQEIGTDFSFAVRFLDKGNRLEQFQKLLKNGYSFKVKDESVTDTLEDLLGYYLLYLVTVKNIKKVGN